MSWHDDHMNAVAYRWGQKYRNSGMTAEAFSNHMRKTMLKYGWSVKETEHMIARAVGKDEK